MALRTSFCREYRFTAAHRLNSPLLSAQQNLSVYEKCNNPNGHGHDYRLEVALKGKPDTQSGMIFPLTEFDRLVHSVLRHLDYHHLDLQVDFFATHISTGEIIIQYLWQQLEPLFPSGMLYHLKLWETNNNYFELGAE